MAWRADNFDLEVPAWVRNLGGWARDIVDFCYPGICPACRNPCTQGQELCPPCTNELATLAHTPACLYCGKSSAYLNAPCQYCNGRGVAHYERVIRLAKFGSPIRELIHQLKFHRAWTVGDMLADQLLQQDQVESLLHEADCLLPVPLHGMRYLARGYNQAELVAGRISRITGIPLARGVYRVRNTDAQTHLTSRARRMKNLKGAFELREENQIAGRRVVVIDDVMTSGATLHTLARALRPAKPASLSALVVAVAEQRY